MKRIVSATILLLLISYASHAQGAREAEGLQRSYQFDKAISLYEKMLDQNPGDSSALKGLILAENGKALTAYAAKPQVVASKRVPRKEFYLYYGHLADKGWDAEGNWWPDGVQEHYYARLNAEGDYDIVRTEAVDDTLWSAPRPFCQDAVSAGNEIFPMVSPDGKRLYFSSDGLFGMGGYDLYVASWDPVKKAWGNVQNMGFPFSSTADDLLFCDTGDGQYSVFASDRDCGKDSIVIYVIRQETPVWSAVRSESVPHLAKLGVGQGTGYDFSRRSAGVRPSLLFEEEEDDFDYSLKVADTAVLLEEESFPSGLVYQIQLFVASKATLKQLKGVSPVFPHRQKSGKTLYAAGVFRSFDAAEQALPLVRRVFPSAFVIAFDDGKPLSLSKARQKESSVKVITEEVHIVK